MSKASVGKNLCRSLCSSHSLSSESLCADQDTSGQAELQESNVGDGETEDRSSV